MNPIIDESMVTKKGTIIQTQGNLIPKATPEQSHTIDSDFTSSMKICTIYLYILNVQSFASGHAILQRECTAIMMVYLASANNLTLQLFQTHRLMRGKWTHTLKYLNGCITQCGKPMIISLRPGGHMNWSDTHSKNGSCLSEFISLGNGIRRPAAWFQFEFGGSLWALLSRSSVNKEACCICCDYAKWINMINEIQSWSKHH